MLVTVIADVFARDEASELADAIWDICAATDNYGWSSAGLYCFWDPYVREIRYIGLAEDLAMRFRQHTGLAECEPKSCKIHQIQSYFATREHLGYSVFVQASQMQPLTAAVRRKLGDRSALLDEWPEDGMEDVRLNEGWLIKAHERLGQKPDWNAIGGSKRGSSYQSAYESRLLRNLVAEDGPLLAHSTIRELSRDETLEWYEETLHAARMRMVLFGIGIREALQMVRGEYEALIGADFAERIDDLLDSGYVDRSPGLPPIARQ